MKNKIFNHQLATSAAVSIRPCRVGITVGNNGGRVNRKVIGLVPDKQLHAQLFGAGNMRNIASPFF